MPVSRSFVNRVLVLLSCPSAPEATVMILPQVELRGVRSEESHCAGDRQLSVLVVESRFLTTEGSIFVGIAGGDTGHFEPVVVVSAPILLVNVAVLNA